MCVHVRTYVGTYLSPYLIIKLRSFLPDIIATKQTLLKTFTFIWAFVNLCVCMLVYFIHARASGHGEVFVLKRSVFWKNVATK